MFVFILAIYNIVLYILYIAYCLYLSKSVSSLFLRCEGMWLCVKMKYVKFLNYCIGDVAVFLLVCPLAN